MCNEGIYVVIIKVLYWYPACCKELICCCLVERFAAPDIGRDSQSPDIVLLSSVSADIIL